MNCKVSKICGGCNYLHDNKEKQAEKKLETVRQCAQQYHIPCKIKKIRMAENDTHYRNKVIVGFSKQKGQVISGLYAAHSHKIVNSHDCLMQPVIVNQVIRRVTELVQSMKIPVYLEKNHQGVLRHMMIRYAQSTKQMMLVFVTATPIFPSRKNLIQVLTKEFPEIQTILQVVNSRDTSVVIENEPMVLYGNGHIVDHLCGLDFSISATAFYQIHSEQCEVLYTLAGKMAQLEKEDTVLDTYCGIGTIGMTLANQCKKVVGVEANPHAVSDARYNARKNKIKNIEFVHMDATRFMKDARRYKQHFDVIILDPPRAGTTQTFISSACALKPKKVLYISCDPKTLMRDLNGFRKEGYAIHQMQCVDMFPYTQHVETVVLMSRVEGK